MPGQTIGYYSTCQEKLLKDFDRTAALVNASLVARYGTAFTSTLRQEAHQEYAQLIPEIPHIQGLRASVLNRLLLGTAQELAVYKAATQISSQTPAVQATIERIRQQEAAQDAVRTTTGRH